MTDTTQKTLGQISYEAQQAYYAKTFPNWRMEQWASLSSHKRNSEEDGAEAIAAPLLARIAELTKEPALLQPSVPTEKEIEALARKIALYHGGHMAMRVDGETKTIAALHGYGSWGHSADTYADRKWMEYVQAAKLCFEYLQSPERDDNGNPK